MLRELTKNEIKPLLTGSPFSLIVISEAEIIILTIWIKNFYTVYLTKS